jgi:antitoxin YqcF
MTEITKELKEVAKHIADAFLVSKPPISRYWDDNRKSDIFVLQADDCPQTGVKSYATVGLSNHELLLDGKPLDTRVELVGACGSAFPNFDNVLATLAFNVINSNWFCAPGIIFPDVMSMDKSSVTTSDIYFTYPFLWDKKLDSTKLFGKNIAWLLAVPVSKSETEYAQKYGPQELENLFAENDIDIFNLNRQPVI